MLTLSPRVLTLIKHIYVAPCSIAVVQDELVLGQLPIAHPFGELRDGFRVAVLVVEHQEPLESCAGAIAMRGEYRLTAASGADSPPGWNSSAAITSAGRA